ncbi:MAG: hypothetical protein AMR96_05155 [Candidatus Adiutrix intracellularis]|nr:MAG: hypothetical protein AMR96_05155 [Candidatus Adiutrix intracellularis]MDR2826817.1 tRNA (adenosine(37)-N6)-dimethylallyltransferase MiaA [Candidatus Adiutrix intracellularis]
MVTSDQPRLAIITGPTGAGKTELILEIAATLGGEIINADSLALYRGFDIGTAKPVIAERAQLPHHLIDVLNPDENFNAASYLRAARPIVNNLSQCGRPALVVGGTGFYLRSLTRGLFVGPGCDTDYRRQLAEEATQGVNLHNRLAAVDPITAARLAPTDRVRIERALEIFHLTGRSITDWQQEHGLKENPFQTLTLIIDRTPDEIEARLKLRIAQMFKRGLVAEVEGLLAVGWSPALKPFGSIGYKETVKYLQGSLTLNEARELTFLATRRYVKRQRTWFRSQMSEARFFHPDQKVEIKTILQHFFTN